MRSRSLQALMVVVAVSSLTGCGDLPVVGNLGDTLSGVTAPIMGLLEPVIGNFLPKPEPTPAPVALRPRRRRIVRQAAVPVAVASASGSATASVETPEQSYRGWAERNRKFDVLRTQGLMQLYGGQTAGALDSFKQAQALRPDDPQINKLIGMIEHPDMQKAGGGLGQAAMADGNPAPPPVPQAPGGLTAQAAGSLLKGAVPAGGDKPGGLF